MFTNLEVAPRDEDLPAGVVGDVGVHDADVVLDLEGVADMSNPIVGRDVTFSDDHGPSAVAVRPLPSPQEPSPAAMARHFLTQLPYASWCPFLCGISPAELSSPSCGRS